MAYNIINTNNGLEVELYNNTPTSQQEGQLKHEENFLVVDQEDGWSQ